MRSKAPLALMEQLVMVLVFALAAALCMQVFALSDRISRQNETMDRALLEAQNAAEILKNDHGDYEKAAREWGGEWNGAMWGLSWDASWTPVAASAAPAYHMLVTPAEGGNALLGAADVTIYTADGALLCTLPVGWQEVDGNG
ncbi:hypothetical protein [Oscillibacter sp.]|uniref:hypothetical protein n=1 Tax=Oscillibacter sp. TaxID=1945593 RepID=UPI002607CE5E|nr:hypothetical protein [Oscillibacter sp.]MDD3347746.1 hypothetical protein [Oscillibacter sp.]